MLIVHMLRIVPDIVVQHNITKKTMHQNTMAADSLNGGKTRTNPNGKKGNNSSTMQRRKGTINSTTKSSRDSTY